VSESRTPEWMEDNEKMGDIDRTGIRRGCLRSKGSGVRITPGVPLLPLIESLTTAIEQATCLYGTRKATFDELYKNFAFTDKLTDA